MSEKEVLSFSFATCVFLLLNAITITRWHEHARQSLFRSFSMLGSQITAQFNQKDIFATENPK